MGKKGENFGSIPERPFKLRIAFSRCFLKGSLFDEGKIPLPSSEIGCFELGNLPTEEPPGEELEWF
jgi:hypothetical protein